MARTVKVSVNTQALMKALLQPLALAACLALPATVKAQQQAPQCEDYFPADLVVEAPEPAIRFAIMDLISQYNWARDDKNFEGITDLFTNDVAYESCMAGNVRVETASGPQDVVSILRDPTLALTEYNLRTRHIVSNTILHQDNVNTVLGKATVLVLIQPAWPESPVLDYTATLKAEFMRDAEDAPWKFRKLTIFMDTPDPILRGGR